MHEFHLADNLVKTALTEAEKHNGKRISALKVRLGGNTHITSDGLEMCIQASIKGTIAEEAIIEIEVFSDIFRCTECTQNYPANNDNKTCPSCESTNVELSAGEVVYLESLQIEQSD